VKVKSTSVRLYLLFSTALYLLLCNFTKPLVIIIIMQIDSSVQWNVEVFREVRRQLPTMVVRVEDQVWSGCMFGEKSGTGASTSSPPHVSIPETDANSLIILSSAIYRLECSDVVRRSVKRADVNNYERYWVISTFLQVWAPAVYP
jgi:hypothetical protein